MKVGSIHKNSKSRYFAVGGYFSYEEDRIKIKAKYKKENLKLKKEKKLENISFESETNKEWLKKFSDSNQLEILNKKIIDELIEDIVIDENKNIKIIFKYEDKYLETLDIIKQHKCDIISSSSKAY